MKLLLSLLFLPALAAATCADDLAQIARDQAVSHLRRSSDVGIPSAHAWVLDRSAIADRGLAVFAVEVSFLNHGIAAFRQELVYTVVMRNGRVTAIAPEGHARMSPLLMPKSTYRKIAEEARPGAKSVEVFGNADEHVAVLMTSPEGPFVLNVDDYKVTSARSVLQWEGDYEALKRAVVERGLNRAIDRFYLLDGDFGHVVAVVHLTNGYVELYDVTLRGDSMVSATYRDGAI